MKKEGKVMLATPFITAGLLGGLFTLIYFLEGPITDWFPNWGDDIQVGLRLLALWLMVSVGVRSANSLSPTMNALKLILVGLLISIGGFIAYGIFLFIHSKAADIDFKMLTDGLMKSNLFFFATAALVSVLVTINLKIKDKFLGNILEVLLIAAVIFALIKLA
jgi:hypothetical protein